MVVESHISIAADVAAVEIFEAEAEVVVDSEVLHRRICRESRKSKPTKLEPTYKAIFNLACTRSTSKTATAKKSKARDTEVVFTTEPFLTHC